MANNFTIDQNGFLYSGSNHGRSPSAVSIPFTYNHPPAFVTPERGFPAIRCSPSDITAAHANTRTSSDEEKYNDAASFDEEQHSAKEAQANKGRVRSIVEANPCIATRKGLLLALKHKQPSQVIRFMLTINPKIMDTIKEGPTPLQEEPTPLQVAVEHEAPLDVIEMLIKASPFDLCITNKDYPEDPLSYAKRNHRDRPGLIELLSRDLEYWVTESKEKRPYHRPSQMLPKQKDNRASASVSFDIRPSNQNRQQSTQPQTKKESIKKPQAPLLSPPPIQSPRRNLLSSIQARKKSPLSQPNPVKKSVLKDKNAMSEKNSESEKQNQTCTAKSNANRDLIDREEINNVKELYAHLVKAHKKMVKAHKKMTQQMLATKGEIESHSRLLTTMGTKKEIFEELMSQQRSQFFRHLIALDMKERAYEGKLKQMEKRYIIQLEKRLDGLTAGMQLWNESTRERVLELKSVVDCEAEINLRFRNEMTDRIEQYHQEDQENNNSMRHPSYAFATDERETDEETPLFGISSIYSGNHSIYNGDRKKGLKGDMETDPIIAIGEETPTTPMLNCVKRRPWRPFSFKNWDCIPLVDGK